MRILHTPEKSLEALLGQCELLRDDVSVASVMILGCESNDYDQARLTEYLRKFPKPVFGAIFPGVILEAEVLQQGAVLVGLPVVAELRSILDLSTTLTDLEERVNLFSNTIAASETIIVFVDGFAARIDELVETLFTTFGLEKNYIGGGAGGLGIQGRPCLFSSEGFFNDGVVLAFLPLPSSIGVRHGWTQVEGPFKVTESDHALIKSLDWQPAFTVYKEAIQKCSGQIINAENFADIAKSFPFGIDKLEGEMIVRDPYQVTAGLELRCVGEVPLGNYVSVLSGDKDTLIAAAIEARGEALAHHQPEKASFMLFMECISRYLFLQEHFKDELDMVRMDGLPLIGALTIGEIANSGKNYLEFYNKTSVVGLLEL